MRNNRSVFGALLMFLSIGTIGQEVLTLDEAFKRALANNYSIQIVESQKEIADNSATIGNAGLLPSVNANASAGIQINNTDLEFAGGLPPTSVDNAQTVNTQAGITANYVLFNGLNGQRTYQKLKLNKDLVDMQSRASIEATLLQVANAYYVLSRANDQVEIASENVTVSKKRFDRAQVANDIGTSLRTEFLAARVDLTTDSSALLEAELQKKTATRQLERLMVDELPDDIQTEATEPEMKPWTVDELITTAKSNNSTLKNSQLQMAMAEKDYQISWSSAFPQLSLSGGYAYSNQQSEAGIVLSNTANGWNGQVALSYPLFNGFRNQTTRQNQKVTMEIRSLELQNQELQLTADIENAWDTYKQSIRIARFEESNLEAAELNLQRSEDLYNNGQIASTQFREAQVAFASSQVRISNARVAVKLNELEIMRLTGSILSE